MGFRSFKINEKCKNWFNFKYSCVSSCSSLGVNFDDSNFISGHFDGTLKIWSTGDKPEAVIEAHDDRINFIEIVKNESKVLTSSK